MPADYLTVKRRIKNLMNEVKAKPVDVAVGILMRPNGDVLLGQRPDGKPYAGYWEFPGGKIELREGNR